MSDKQNNETAAEPPKPQRPSALRRILKMLLLVAAPVALGLAGFVYFVENARFVTTENAYIRADTIAISTDVDGRVTEVFVSENEQVSVGQILFRIDERPFRLSVEQSETEMQTVANEIVSYQAAYRQRLAELELAQSDVSFYRRGYNRQRALSERGTVAQAQHDEARHELRTAEQKINTIREDIALALSRLGGDPSTPAESHPRYLTASNKRDQALLDFERTVVRSPVTGTIGSVRLQAGEYVEAGEALFSVVASDAQWITANLKETQLTHLSTGQEATIRADAYPDHEWRARVSSISPATGAEFSLLPPQNASGNWVKVVQRIPVRLTLAKADDGPVLRTGMSVSVRIDTERELDLPPSVTTMLAWISSITGRAVIASSEN